MKPIIINARFLTQTVTGVQRFAIELCLLLKHKFDNIIFVAPYNIKNTETAAILGVIKYGKLKGHLWEQLELPVFVAGHGNGLLVNFCNTAPLFYKNKIVTVHDLAFVHHPEWFSYLFSTLYKFLIPKILRRSLCVITVSQTSKNDIVNTYKISPSKIKIIYNGISKVFDFKNNQPNGLQAPRVLNKIGTHNYILAVSSIDPRKNFIKLIEAFNKFNNPFIHLVIVGSANANFSNQVFEIEKHKVDLVHFTGYIADAELVYLYQNALAFIYPSLFEGFGIPPLEAMACGCPTIVSKIPSLEEVYGDAAYYINPSDIESIANGMKIISEDPVLREELVGKGLKKAQDFLWMDSANTMADIINSYSYL